MTLNQTQVELMFQDAPFVNNLGIKLKEIKSGYCVTFLQILPQHLQQTGVVHAGVITTIADHTAGGAATTVLRENQFILSVEFKVNLLRAAQGDRLECHSQVIKSGATLISAESEVFAIQGEKSTLVSKAWVTLAVLTRRTAP